MTQSRVLTRFGRRGSALGWLAMAATLLGCSGSTLDVGSDPPMNGGTGTGASGGGGSAAGTVGSGGGTPGGGLPEETLTRRPSGPAPQPGWNDPRWDDDATCEPAPDSPLVGRWRGHWPGRSPVDSEIVLDIAGLTVDGLPCGSVTIGEGPALTPPTDPDAAYPTMPELGGYDFSSASPGPIFVGITPWPGFSYSLIDVEVGPARLAFRLAQTEVWRDWCALQRPWPGSSRITPGTSFGSSSREGSRCIVFDDELYDDWSCARLKLSSVCTCTEAGCDATPDWEPLDFELHADDGAWEGTYMSKNGVLFLDPVP